MRSRLHEGFGDYTSVGDALAAVIENLQSGRGEKTLGTRESYHRVAARNLTAPKDIPEFAASHMDGFAVISGDLRNATGAEPVRLKVVGSGKLGDDLTRQIHHGESVRVATGGRLPAGSDAVLPLETVEEADGALSVRLVPKRGDHVYPAGGDVRKGETVLSEGQLIRAQDVGMLISLGISKVRVRSRTVSVIATGSELTDSERPPRGKVRNSHTPVFLRLCEAQSCRALDRGVVPDDVGKVRSAVRRALADSDFVITLGGTSVGRHDAVGDALRSMRPEAMFHGLKMDRGRVTGVAAIGGKPVLMAPGPIQGAMNAFILLGVPIIRHLTGTKQRDVLLPCTLGSDWKARERFADFQKVVYAKLTPGEEAVAEPLLGETESAMTLSRADGYIWVPENVTELSRGTRVTVRLLPGLSS